MTSSKATENLRTSLIEICSVNAEFITLKKTETTAVASVSLLKIVCTEKTALRWVLRKRS